MPVRDLVFALDTDVKACGVFGTQTERPDVAALVGPPPRYVWVVIEIKQTDQMGSDPTQVDKARDQIKAGIEQLHTHRLLGPNTGVRGVVIFNSDIRTATMTRNGEPLDVVGRTVRVHTLACGDPLP